MNRQELRDQLGLDPPIFAGIVDSLVGERRIELQEELIRIPGRGVTMQSDEAESKKADRSRRSSRLDSRFPRSRMCWPRSNSTARAPSRS